MRVLLVEDDPMIGKAVCQGLTRAGLCVDWVTDGRAAELSIANQVYQTVILDLGLPRQDGLAVLAAARSRHNPVPVLIATARDAVADRIAGLNAGADDYLVKPYDLDELIARVRALIRRHAGNASPVLECGPLRVDPVARTVRLDGQPVELSAREFSVLAHARGIDLGAEIDPLEPGAAEVPGDTQHLRMLLDNLVGNALQYTPRGGKVDVALHVVQSLLVLEVADSGPGIALAERERVFDRFFRGSTSHGAGGPTQGAGLGLAIAREVAQQHGASIHLLEGLLAPDGMRGLTVRVNFGGQNATRMANAA